MFDDLQIGPQFRLDAIGLSRVLAAYDITPLTAPHLLGGAVNGVARVETDGGPVVVRVHRPWADAERLEGVHRVLRQLRERGLPVPRSLVTSDGRPWTMLEGRLAEVAEWVPHDGAAVTREGSGAAFIALSELHAVLATLNPAILPPPAYSSYADLAIALSMLGETDAAFRAHRDEEGYEAARTARADARTLFAALAAERRDYQSDLPRQLVHGDYGGDNVLLRGGCVVAVLDWDYMAHRERVFDLAYALYWTLDRLRTSPPSEGFADGDLRRAAELLRRYAEGPALPLTAVEQYALPFELARVPLYPLAEAGYVGDVPYLAGPVAETLAAARHLPTAARLAADAPHVRALLAGRG